MQYSIISQSTVIKEDQLYKAFGDKSRYKVMRAMNCLA